MRAQGGVAHHARVPVHAGADQHGLATRQKLEHLDELDADRLGNELGSLLKKGIDVIGPQRMAAEVRQRYRLLTQPFNFAVVGYAGRSQIPPPI